MGVVNIDQLGAVKPAVLPSAGNDFWTPQNINMIIKGVGELLAQYTKLKGGGGNNDVMDSSRENVARAPLQAATPVITMQQVLGIGKQFCVNLEAQGYGDNTILQVLEKLPFTIKQIKELIP